MADELFEFQNDFMFDIGRAFRTNRRVVAQLATGGGKTHVMGEITRRSALKNNIICVAVHREEILQQTFNTLRNFGITPSLIVPGNHPMPGAQVYLGMVETIKRRMTKDLINRLNINFFITDEAHRGEFFNLISQLDCKVLGLTATPKTTGKPELKDYFDTIVCGIPIGELIRIGRLVPTITYSVRHDFSKVKRKGNDFDDKALAAEFKKPVLRDGAFDYYLQYCKGDQALAYCVTVADSNALTLRFREAGIKAAHMDGTTLKDDRRRLWQMYRNKELDIICNVGIATTGTDLPQTRCIIKNYASLSTVKDVQVGGRGGRCDEGKTHFKTIDMGGNYLRHGEFGENIDWEFIFQNPSTATKEENKREKCECAECGAVMRIGLQVCPYCGAFSSQKEVEARLLLGASIEEIRDYKMRNMPVHLRKPLMLMNYEEVKAFGVYMNYSPRWIHTYWNKRKHEK